jgi:hypothetical protein
MIPEEYGGLGLGAFEYCLVTALRPASATGDDGIQTSCVIDRVFLFFRFLRRSRVGTRDEPWYLGTSPFDHIGGCL